MWKVAHSRRFSSIQSAVRAKTSFSVVIESEHERSVYLNAIVVQHAHAARVVGCLRGLLVGVGEVVIGQRFEADENACASGERHVPDERRIVRHVDGYGCAPDFVQRPERGAQRVKIVAARAEVVIDKNCVGLVVCLKFFDHLLRMLHAIRHPQPVGSEIAESASVVATSRCDQAGGCQETSSWKNRAPGGGIVTIIVLVGCNVARLQCVSLDIAQDARPELHAVAKRERVRVRSAFVGTRQHMKSAQDHLRSARAIPIGERECPLGEREMNGDPHDLRHGLERRTSVEQVFIPVIDPPWIGGGRREARQCQSRREYMLAEAGVRVFGVEGIDQKRIVILDRSSSLGRFEGGSHGHLTRNPARPNRSGKRILISCHDAYFIIQSTSCQQRDPFGEFSRHQMWPRAVRFWRRGKSRAPPCRIRRDQDGATRCGVDASVRLNARNSYFYFSSFCCGGERKLRGRGRAAIGCVSCPTRSRTRLPI